MASSNADGTASPANPYAQPAKPQNGTADVVNPYAQPTKPHDGTAGVANPYGGSSSPAPSAPPQATVVGHQQPAQKPTNVQGYPAPPPANNPYGQGYDNKPVQQQMGVAAPPPQKFIINENGRQRVIYGYITRQTRVTRGRETNETTVYQEVLPNGATRELVVTTRVKKEGGDEAAYAAGGALACCLLLCCCCPTG